MMKSILSILLCSMVSLQAVAGISVVVHPSNNAQITSDDITQLYMGKTKSFPDGSSAVPIGQEENSTVTKDFNEKVMNRTSQQIKAYWSKQVFSGKGTPPRVVSNDDEVLSLISTNPNLIGYIDSSKVDDSVKVIFTM